jgi:histidine triad (HIT) family protein
MTTDPECIFCRIATGQLPAEVVARADRVLAFRDLDPQAPTHVLVIPQDHYENVVELAGDDPKLLAELVTLGSDVAKQEAGGQFRLVFNTGTEVGQSVLHAHGHVLAGRSFGWPPG